MVKSSRAVWMIDAVLLGSLSVAALVVVLVCAVLRPFRWPEAAFAVPAAAIVGAAGAIPLEEVREEAARLGPMIGFLAAVLVLAKLCDTRAFSMPAGHGWPAGPAADRAGCWARSSLSPR